MKTLQGIKDYAAQQLTAYKEELIKELEKEGQEYFDDGAFDHAEGIDRAIEIIKSK